MRREAADVWFQSVFRHNHKHFAAPFLMLIISFLCWKVYITVALAPSSTYTQPQHISNNELLTFLQLLCEICFHAPFCKMICATPSRLFTPSALWKAGSVDTNNTAKPRRRTSLSVVDHVQIQTCCCLPTGHKTSLHHSSLRRFLFLNERKVLAKILKQLEPKKKCFLTYIFCLKVQFIRCSQYFNSKLVTPVMRDCHWN